MPASVSDPGDSANSTRLGRAYQTLSLMITNGLLISLLTTIVSPIWYVLVARSFIRMSWNKYGPQQSNGLTAGAIGTIRPAVGP